MTKQFYFETAKSPIIIIGLFCCLSLILGCQKETDPNDVTIMFWVALSENKPDKAKKYSANHSEKLLDKKIRGASIQTGKVEINYDDATVETFINRQSAASGSSFKTYLVRVKKTDHWKVNYNKTLTHIKDKEFKNLFTALKELGSDAKIHAKDKLLTSIKDKSKSTWVSIKNWFKKQKNKLLN